MPEKKKIGRPTDDPKTVQFSVRFDETTLKILDDFCRKNAMTRPQGVREAVRRLKEK